MKKSPEGISQVSSVQGSFFHPRNFHRVSVKCVEMRRKNLKLLLSISPSEGARNNKKVSVKLKLSSHSKL